MSQQINLFNPAFRKPPAVLLSALTTAVCLAVTLLTLFATQLYSQQRLKGLDAELRSAQNLVKEKVTQNENVKSAGAARAKDVTLETEIAKLEAELKLSKSSIDALKTGAFAAQQGYAEYMRAFSRQALNGLWLTGFTIASGGDIAIQGRVANPDLVPAYIQRLNQEKVLHGRSFGTFEMRQPQVSAAAGDPGKGDKNLPRYLEFSLTTTSEAAAGGVAVAKTAGLQ